MRILLFSILLLFCSFTTVSGESESLSQTDSLIKILPTLPNDTTLLQALETIVRSEEGTPRCITYAKILLEKAKEQNNDRSVVVAIYLQVIHHHNNKMQDSVVNLMKQIKPYVDRSKLWSYYYDALKCQIEGYTYRKQFELAVNKSIEMGREAKDKNNLHGQISSYQCLISAYLGTRRMSEAKAVSDSVHHLLGKTKNLMVKIEVLSQLIALSREMKDYESQLKLMKERELLLLDYAKTYPNQKMTVKLYLLYNEVFYVYYYNALNMPEQSLEHIKLAYGYLGENTYAPYETLFNDALAGYYRLCKDFDQALFYINLTVKELYEADDIDYIDRLGVKADILTEIGRYSEALPIYREILQSKDSLEASLSDQQMSLIQDNYQIDKLAFDREQLKSNIQCFTLLFALLIVIALLFITIYLSRIQKALKLAEKQTREATQIAQKANGEKNNFLTNISNNIRVPLNSVVKFSQIIATDLDLSEEKRKEYSAIIQKNSKDLIRLMNDVLDLSRLEANMTKFQVYKNDVVNIANDTICMIGMHNQSSIHIQFHNKTLGEVPVMTDSARLIQTLQSILIYPKPCDVEREVIFTLSLTDDKAMVCFCVQNCPLADTEFASQEVTIRHEINRLFLEYFGGSYTLFEQTPEGPTLVITYPTIQV